MEYKKVLQVSLFYALLIK